MATAGWAASFGSGSACGWKMRKMPAASGEESGAPASAMRGSLSGVPGATSGEVRKAASWSMLLLAMRRSMAVVGGRPGVVVAGQGRRFGRLLAGDAQGAPVVAVEHVPDPGDGGLMLDHLGGEITAHAIGRRAFARHHRQPAGLRLVVEVLHQALKLIGRRPVDGLEGDGGAARLAGRGDRAVVGIAGGERQRAESRDEQTGPGHTLRATRQARPPELHCIDTPVAGFFSLSPSTAAERSGSNVPESSASGV